MIPRLITRRRVLAISAASVLLPASRPTPPPLQWSGSVLGAAGSIMLYHPDEAEGRRAIAACLDEIERLEACFSLYRPDSEVSRLNEAGRLEAPSHDMRRLLTTSLAFSRATGGAFDPTVQPLYRLFAEHFRANPDDESGPDADSINQALDLVGWRGVTVTPERIALARGGMAITLNGIAQGYIADSVARLLTAAGFQNVLLDLGEMRAIGGRADDAPFRVAIKSPAGDRPSVVVPLVQRAMATSGGYGTRFDHAGRFHHLLDAATGRSPRWFASVTVLAPTATQADALSTAAAAVAPPAAAIAMLRQAGVSAVLQGADGTVTRLG